jgi:hypothetical protein
VKTIYVMLMAVLLFLPACNRDRVRASDEGTTTNTEEMKRQRDDYVRSVNAKLDEFDQKFDGLDARAAALSGPAKDGFKNAVDGLRDQRKAVSRKLDDLKGVSINSWMPLKGEVDAALAGLERSYEQVSASHETVPAAVPKTAPPSTR